MYDLIHNALIVLVADCMDVWKTIRGGYTRKVANPPSGSGAAVRRFLVLQTKMAFLDGQIAHRR
jgi:hypothetical protein